MIMRQSAKLTDEPYLFIRSLSLNYAKGTGEARHRHDWPQLLYTSRGTIRARLNNKIWFVPPRHALWIPANTQHSTMVTSPAKLRTLYLREPLSPDTARIIRVQGLLHEAILRSCSLGYLDERIARDRHLGTVIQDEISHSTGTISPIQWPSDSRAIQLAAILANPDKYCDSLSQICADIGIGRRTAERVFRKETGFGPSQWRRTYILAESLENISNGISIEHTSFLAGYADRSAFSTAFQQAFGHSPGSKT